MRRVMSRSRVGKAVICVPSIVPAQMGHIGMSTCFVVTDRSYS